MKKFSVITIIGGAAIIALSILFFRLEGTWLWLCVVLVAFGILTMTAGIVVLCRAASAPKRFKLADGVHYTKKKSIMSAPETEFFGLLKSIIDLRKYDILPQIALAVIVDKVDGNGYRNELFRIVDFLIVDRRAYAPLLIVELNDASHKRDDRKLRDEKVNAICADAKMPIAAIDLQNAFDVTYVRATLKRYI